MISQETITSIQKLLPCLILIGYVFVEIINAIRGKNFLIILLVREFRKIIMGVLIEINEKELE